MGIGRESRQAQILKQVRENSGVRVIELCRALGTSEATIRRDLDDLQQAGLIRRTHGGALLVKAEAVDREVLQRAETNKEEKRAIARRAATMVEDGDTIFIGSGSTTIFMPDFLREKKDITIITNSLPVINRLVELRAFKTVVLGGMLRESELSLIGHIAIKALEDLRAHKVFMGVEAVHLEHGLTNSYLEETMTDRAIVGVSKEIILLADHTKFGKIHASFWAPIKIARYFVTDSGVDSSVIERLTEQGVEVIVAPAEGAEAGSL